MNIGELKKLLDQYDDAWEVYIEQQQKDEWFKVLAIPEIVEIKTPFIPREGLFFIKTVLLLKPLPGPIVTKNGSATNIMQFDFPSETK